MLIHHVLIVHPTRLYADALATSLNQFPNIEARASAGSTEAVAETLRTQKVSVVLCELGSLGALELAANCANRGWRTLLLPGQTPPKPGQLALSVPGDAPVSVLYELIDLLHDEYPHRTGGGRPSPSHRERAPALTRREQEVLAWLEKGASNRLIANGLSISLHTVKNHVHSALKKMGARSRGEAVALARVREKHHATRATWAGMHPI